MINHLHKHTTVFTKLDTHTLPPVNILELVGQKYKSFWTIYVSLHWVISCADTDLF